MKRSIEQYVFSHLTGFIPEREQTCQVIVAAMVSAYACNAKLLMDRTDEAVAAATPEMLDEWRTGWLPKGARQDYSVNRRALSIAFTAASFAGCPSTTLGLRNLRRIYAGLGNGA